MIQFNLLPDVKLEYVKAQRAKHTAITISTIAAVAALVVMLILFLVVDVWQKKSLSDLNRDISKYSSQIKSTPNLNKILTVQNQLNALPTLDAQKPAVSRLFGYVSQLTPTQASISKLTVDFTKNTWDVSGTADSLGTVDKFVDTFKFTTYKTDSSSKSAKAFSNVVLASFGVSSQGASYEITASFDPVIFDSSKNVTLNVPNIISTRSETQQPKNLFTGSTNSNSGGQ